jgi:hypothetical protein
MKKILSIAVLFGALHMASAATTNIYVENWGTGNSGVTGNGNINTVGWTAVAVTQTAGPYVGIYTATGASDPATGEALPANTAYFSVLLPTQTTPGMLYTTDTSGSGSGGNSAFADINPTLYTNLTLSAEVRNGGGAPGTNYFAVRVGGSWYVATSYVMPDSGALSYPNFTNAFLVYTNPANVWNALTINTTDVTIGSVASPNLSSPITGIGVVLTPTTGQPNFNRLAVQVFVPNPPPPTPTSISATAITPQYSYIGGGASFLIQAGGTPPLTYIWETNGVPLQSGGRYLGTTNNMLTITNINANDALVTYSVIVTNTAGSATNSGLTLNVQSVPAGVLYAEDFPYVGPNGNLLLTGVGWVTAAAAGSFGIYSAGPGLGDVFSYSAAATTNAYFTTDTNETGLSGLPFVDINPASYPAVTLQANFVPGNAAGQVPGAVTVYWAVQMNGTWYSSAKPIQITLTALSPYLTNQFGFNPAVTNWNNLTIAGTAVTIGAQVSSPLTGNITGAGLIFVHNASGGDMNFQYFQIVTNQAVGTAPYIGSNIPLDVGVASGGGASFGVSATGTQPFTYDWTTNGVPVHNGGRVSGATTPTLTIANLNSGDNGMQIVAFVTNSAGFDQSDSIYFATTLTVTNPPVGLIYSEQFPFVGPLVANYPISSIGWVEAVPSAPNALFQTAALTSGGAVFAYLGTPGTTVYYATAASDTNQAGLPFPNINLASYPSLNFSVDIAPSFAASNVTAFVVVQLNGTSWYVAASPLAVPTTVDSATYATYTMAFNRAAANWKNITVTSSGGLVGSTAASNLSGMMTGAGLVFVTVGTGGNFNFDNFQITGTGLGGINVGPQTGGNINLSWVGNPAVNLQSTTNLIANWQDVANTLGLYSLPVPGTGPQKFFRLVKH